MGQASFMEGNAVTLRKKLALAATLLGIAPAIIASIILGYVAEEFVRAETERQAQNQLISVRDTKKNQLEHYFETIRDQLLTYSNDRMIIDAMREFTTAFKVYDEELDRSRGAYRDRVAEYYRRDFATAYAERNPGRQVDVNAMLDRLTLTSLALQLTYIRENPGPPGGKGALVDPNNGTQHSEVHKKFHRHIRDFQRTFGYYDIFLIEPENGYIVYSVSKELDFGTSLKSGPYAGSGIAEAFRAANRSGDSNYYYMTDFAPYTPAYEAAASFIATPIFDQSRKIGVLIFQMPIDRINRIMTNDGKWQAAGLGESGESYLVGEDMVARSESRFLIEDKTGYLQRMSQRGGLPEIAAQIDAKGTNIGIQRIETAGTRAALSGESGVSIFDDERNVSVLSAYAPVDALGQTWALIAEIDAAEAFRPSTSFSGELILAAVVAVLLAAGLASVAGLRFSGTTIRPINELAATINSIEQDSDLTRRVGVDSNSEIGSIGDALNRMLQRFHNSMREISTSVSQLADASQQMSVTSAHASDGTRRQQAETDRVATAISQMLATVQSVAGHASAAAASAKQADGEASNGNRVVLEAIDVSSELMREVERSAQVIHKVEADSGQIGMVLDVIKDIAEQTNLLALNAAIEAARAGEQGRGFAVVADEVRTLASRTQESAQEIQQVIEQLQVGSAQAAEAMKDAQLQAEESVDKARSAGDSLRVITGEVSTISETNLQIASATEEQSAVVEEINRNITAIKSVLDEAARGTRQTSDASENMTQLATQLQRLVSNFKV